MILKYQLAGLGGHDIQGARMNIIEKITNRFLVESPMKMWGRVFNLNKKVLVPLDKFDLFVMKNDYIGRSIYNNREYEPHVTKIVKAILGEGDVFLDLGGNIGFFTMLGSAIVGDSSGKVIVFEPNPQNVQLIFSSIAANRFTNIKVFPLAASDKSAILRFTTVGSNGGVVTPHSKDQNFYFYVQAVRLDELLKDESRLDLVKIDIEAHEPYAIKGFEQTIRRLRPKIITEFHPWAMQLNNVQAPIEYLELLRSYGYLISIITCPSGKLIATNSADEIIEYWKALDLETAHLDLLCHPN